MKGFDDGLCRNCPLPSCDDEHPACFYRIFVQEQTRQNNAARDKEASREAYRKFYAANRSAEIARVAAYDAANVEKRRRRQREYYQRSKAA